MLLFLGNSLLYFHMLANSPGMFTAHITHTRLVTVPKVLQTYHASSSVQSAIKGLLEKNFVTATLGEYEVYDKFFALWILQQQGLRT